MRAVLFLISLLLAGCERAENTFEVDAAGAVSAEITLCGKTSRLEREGEKFTGTYPVRCEGAGTIKVSFENQPPVNCPIGYVTPGAVQRFHFVVEDGICD